MDDNKFFENISTDDLKYIGDDEELKENPFYDKFSTAEQKERDKYITTLLESYVVNYQNKTKKNKEYKDTLFNGFLTWTKISLIAFFVCVIYFLCNLRNLDSKEYILKILPICITFITLIIGTLKIIVKYVFPEKEEEYITKIVEIIQNNDLEHKKENIRCNQSITNTSNSGD
ncbi:hypothetical protein [Oribacterium sinus]|uniref:hypothetical protein n=1 Tax=Oribacterium sinus TaxID=237576 RepID=UPI0028E3AB00|nr:hypothetical protein [Oribacterium sinus]